MQNSNDYTNGIGEYLYDFINKRYELCATPDCRKPLGKKESFRIIAKNKNGMNKYPQDNRLLPPIPVKVGNKTLYRFEYN